MVAEMLQKYIFIVNYFLSKNIYIYSYSIKKTVQRKYIYIQSKYICFKISYLNPVYFSCKNIHLYSVKNTFNEIFYSIVFSSQV